MTQESTRESSAVARLRRFVAARPEVERCDLCSREVGPMHDHLLEFGVRRVVCACGACAVLFSGQADTRYKRIPRRSRSLPDFRMTDGQWDALRLPIELAFLFRSSVQKRIVACYPSPAGSTESSLSLETWQDIEIANPLLTTIADDVEALLVNRVGYSRGVSAAEYYLVPIDRCFALVGIIRSHWSGLSGGTDVWREITKFFAELRERSDAVREATHA